MIKKTPGIKGQADVTFTIYPPPSAQSAAVFGDWNSWKAGAAMYPVAGGGFSRTVRLDAGNAGDTYQFKHVLDADNWVNDPAADGYADGNSVVDLTDPALGNGPDLVVPSDLEELAAASASDFTGSAADRIAFLSTASVLLETAEDPKTGSGVPPELIPPITKVVLDVLDFIDRNLSAPDLDTLTGLKQNLATLLQQSVPAIQATPVPLVQSARRTGR